MRFIKKLRTENGEEKEPDFLIDWKQQNRDTINERLKSKRTGKELWQFLHNNQAIYQQFKDYLVNEQGFICCYCGRRIGIDRNTRLEHLFPKSKEEYRERVFDYHNLLASCQGGSKSVIHIVQEGETVEGIVEQYNVSIEWLETIYVTTENIENICQNYDLDNLDVNDTVLVFPKILDEKQQHCDVRKGSKEINVHPLQINCQSRLAYSKYNGEVDNKDATDIETRETIDKLGLNDNAILLEQRQIVINEAINKLDEIRKLEDIPQMISLIHKLRERYASFDSERKLKAFNFVTLSILGGN